MCWYFRGALRFTLSLVALLIVASLIGVVAPAVTRAVVRAAPVAQEPVYLPIVTQPQATDENAPLDVTPQLDQGRAVSETLPLDGGEVVATGADGTCYVLTVPPAALAYTTTVTLTPIPQIAGLPDAQLVAAVQIEPVGLAFLQAATLRIEPATSIAVGDELPFAFYATGEDFHRYPILPYEPGWVYPIGQIDGGYGMAQVVGEAALQAQTSAQVVPSYTPADAEARLREQASALIQQERIRVLMGEAPNLDLWAELRPLFLEYYALVIEPFLEASRTDCDVAKATMPKALGWTREVQLLYGEHVDAELRAADDAIMDALLAAARNCYREAAQPCMDWTDPVQVRDVLSNYRMLALLGETEGEVDPFDLPECTTVDVQLGAGGSFHYEFEKDDEAGYATSYNFRIVDDTVSGIGVYNPFNAFGSDATAYYTTTVLIDGEWQPVSTLQRFFCRDKKAERIDGWKIEFRNVQGEPEAPPQLFADNIGCWRWTGTYQYDIDYNNISNSVPIYYQNKAMAVTFERKDGPDEFYVPYLRNGEVYVPPRDYRLLPEGTVQYDERWQSVDNEGNITCDKTLHLDLTGLEAYFDVDSTWLRVPNAGFGAEREMNTSLDNELRVDAPYTLEGDCYDYPPLDVIRLSLRESIGADGKSIQIDETGYMGEKSGTYHRVIDLRALREE